MDFAILHLTDLHFSERTDLRNRVNSFCRTIINQLTQVENLYIVLSGDLTFTGKKAEFDKVKEFLSGIKQLIVGELKTLKIKYIIVPGNHDCNFNLDNQLRKNILPTINYESLGSDNSVIDLCLITQQDFWNFYAFFSGVPSNKLFYTITDKIGNKTINFNCYNTSWISQLNEEPGKIFFPVKRFDKITINKNEVNFGVWHHPYNWFNPNTFENNKTEFESFTEKLSSINFFGHEHVNSLYTNENRNTGKRVNLLAGEIFNDDKKDKSGFQILLVDIQDNKAKLKKYDFNGTHYIEGDEKNLEIKVEVGETFIIKDEFYKSLQEIKIPLVIEGRKEIKLTDIYVFPDMEMSKKDFKTLDNYHNSSLLLENDFNHCILDGENQVGKSSLLAMLFLKFHEAGKFPILLQGKDIRDHDLEKIIKRSFKNQYKNSNIDIDKYLQLGKEDKVLLIDDYQDCILGSNATKDLFEKANLNFGKVITIFDSANSILSTIKIVLSEVKYFTIKPFGYKKRNELIERYHKLRRNPLTYEEHTFLAEVKDTFDNVQSILGDKLMPSYPIYILSIIQALQYTPLKQNETSYGYCYQTLIHYSLHKAGISNEELDTYFNFLSELAFEFLSKQTEVLSNLEITEFYLKYANKFMCPSLDTFLQTLKKSKIIQVENQTYKFCYNYILYYLSAKKISEIIHEKSGKDIVTFLFNNLHEEKYANILVFVTDHSKDISFIESSMISTMMVLENAKPITLQKDDPYYKEISNFVENIKNDIIETNRSPATERNKELLKRDEEARKNEESLRDENYSNTDDDDEMKKTMLPFLQSFRSIEIVGQIIKNRKGSLEINQIKQMLTELYTTGFRTIGYYGELLNTAKEEIIAIINEKMSSNDTKKDIEDKINSFIQMISFRMCINVFGKLMQTTGNKELKKIFIDVANEMNTPAAKLVTFGINSYYGTINAKELKDLVEELKGNIVAIRILKFRVRAYIYNKNLDHTEKQRLASLLDMSLTPLVHKNIGK